MIGLPVEISDESLEDLLNHAYNEAFSFFLDDFIAHNIGAEISDKVYLKYTHFFNHFITSETLLPGYEHVRTLKNDFDKKIFPNNHQGEFQSGTYLILPDISFHKHDIDTENFKVGDIQVFKKRDILGGGIAKIKDAIFGLLPGGEPVKT